MTEESLIFTRAECEALNRRFENDKKDKNGLYCHRVKPKIIEILDKWLPLKDKLEKLLDKGN